MIHPKIVQRIKENAQEHGSPFEFQLSLTLVEADLEQQDVIREAFPDFIRKFRRYSGEFYENDD